VKTNRRLLTVLLIAITLSVLSCTKEEDQSKNYFNYDGKNYGLAAGYGFYDQDTDTDPPAYFHEVVLVGRGITVTENDFAGTGNLIAFTIGSASQTVEPGTYHYNLVEGSFKAGDLVSGLVGFNVNTEDYTGIVHFFSDGKVVVTRSGDTYTLDVDVVADGKPLKVHFVGPLPTFSFQ
jgi:hypothetical protein